MKKIKTDRDRGCYPVDGVPRGDRFELWSWLGFLRPLDRDCKQPYQHSVGERICSGKSQARGNDDLESQLDVGKIRKYRKQQHNSRRERFELNSPKEIDILTGTKKKCVQ